MNFTQEQKEEYMDRLSLATKHQMWQVEMSIIKTKGDLAKKKALLSELEQQLENKEFKTANDGKNQIKYTKDKITKLEAELEESHLTLQSGEDDLKLIEDFRKIPV